jgi:predicted HTH transcriptional regulator
VFRELDLIEEWGSGYKRVMDACQTDSYPEPVWQQLGVALRVLFYPHTKVVEHSERNWGRY